MKPNNFKIKASMGIFSFNMNALMIIWKVCVFGIDFPNSRHGHLLEDKVILSENWRLPDRTN